jgi:hypothetical protein
MNKKSFKIGAKIISRDPYRGVRDDRLKQKNNMGEVKEARSKCVVN